MIETIECHAIRAIEAMFTIQALAEDCLPPTCNLRSLDEVSLTLSLFLETEIQSKTREKMGGLEKKIG